MASEMLLSSNERDMIETLFVDPFLDRLVELSQKQQKSPQKSSTNNNNNNNGSDSLASVRQIVHEAKKLVPCITMSLLPSTDNTSSSYNEANLNANLESLNPSLTALLDSYYSKVREMAFRAKVVNGIRLV